jgi:hypothetical protein
LHFTLQVFNNLVTLATSHYSNVRSRSQDVLLKMLHVFPGSYRPLLPRLIALVKNDSGVTHEEFKVGAL